MTRRDVSDSEYQLLALFEEYRALYELAVFRMTALDRRAPVTAGAFAAAVVALHVFPPDLQLMVLIAVPIALVWLMRTTINHARSFEDALRRIEFIEQSVNELVGRAVLGFQSLHPSRGRQVGGRTGYESVLAVFGSIQLLLAAAAYEMHSSLHLPLFGQACYFILLTAVSMLTVRETVTLSRYRYGAAVSND